jgi:hypothetical protein
MSNEVILRPATLIAQPRDLPSNYICVFHPRTLRLPSPLSASATQFVALNRKSHKMGRA